MSNDKQISFLLNLPNGEEIQLPPKRTTTNKDIYKYAKKYTKDDLILLYNSTPIPENIKINLIEIGYDPYKPLLMFPCESKEIKFEISQFKYTFTKKILSYQTFFDAKKIFATDFNTIPQNIIIKKNSELMSDNLRIFEKIHNEEPFFEIDVVEGYSLYYVFFYEFFFICLPETSTIKDMKTAIAGYKNYFVNGIMYGPKLAEVMKIVTDTDKAKIKDYSSKIPFLDFEFRSKNPPNELIDIYIDTIDNNNVLVYHDNFQCYSFDKLPSKPVIESIKCMLESKLHINKDALVIYDDPKHYIHNEITFYSLKKLYVMVGKKPETFPYLITIKDLKQKYCSIDSNAGFIINSSFVFEENDFLAKYLGNSVNDEKTRLQINIVRPDTKCRLCKIQTVKDMKINSMIIPLFYTFNQIATTYYGKKANSMQFFYGSYSKEFASNPIQNTEKLENTQTQEFHAIIAKELVVKYHFNDNKKEYTIKMSNDNDPQIKDFIFEIFKENQKKQQEKHKEKYKEKFHVYEVYAKDKRVNFWEYLIEYVDQVLTVKTVEHQKEIKLPDSKFIRIYNATVNSLVRYNITKFDIKAKQLINDSIISTNSEEKTDLSNYSLYLNFHKLRPDDMPMLLFQKNDFLILNSNEPEREFKVTNGHGIERSLKIPYDSNQFISAAIINDFNLINKDVNFYLKLDQESEIPNKNLDLPSIFDAGSIPDKSVISVSYKHQDVGMYSFEYEGNRTKNAMVKLSDSKKPIIHLKKEIIEQMKLFNVSPKAAVFEFLGNKLDQNRTFSSYNITDNSRIIVKNDEDIIKVSVFLFDETKLGNYFFKSGENAEEKDTVKDVIEQLKLEYNLDEDSNVKIYSQPNKNSIIDKNQQLEKGVKFYASFDKIKIKLFDPNGEKIDFDEILKPTKEFMREKIIPRIPEGSSITPSNLILYKREGTGHYVPVDGNKTFRDIGDRQYFALRKITDISFFFKDTEIKISDELSICEFESMRDIVKYYISNSILASPSLIKLTINSIEVNEKETIGNLMLQKKKIQIDFKEKADESSPYSETKPKAKISKLRYYKPKKKVEENEEANNKPQKSENTKGKGKDKKQGTTNKDLENYDSKESEEEPEAKEEEEVSKAKKEEPEVKEEKSTQPVSQNENEVKIEEEEEVNDDANSLKPSSSAVKSEQNENEVKIEEEEEVSEAGSSKKSVNKDDEDDDDEEEGDERTHTFVVKGKVPFQITLPKDATVKDYLVEIAKHEEVTEDDVSIIFAGKKLRSKKTLDKMKIKRKEEITVIISEPQDILLKTAKALKIIPSDLNDDDDDEYEYEYYDDDEEEEQ